MTPDRIGRMSSGNDFVSFVSRYAGGLFAAGLAPVMHVLDWVDVGRGDRAQGRVDKENSGYLASGATLRTTLRGHSMVDRGTRNVSSRILGVYGAVATTRPVCPARISEVVRHISHSTHQRCCRARSYSPKGAGGFRTTIDMGRCGSSRSAQTVRRSRSRQARSASAIISVSRL